MKRLDTAKVKDAVHGRWPEILTALGIPSESLQNRHGPCPACGGKDRFRFDDRHGNGDFYCNGCGAGDGFALLMRMHGWDFPTTLKEVGHYVGILTNVPAQRRRVHSTQQPIELETKGIIARVNRLETTLIQSWSLDDGRAMPGLRYLATRLGMELPADLLQSIAGKGAPDMGLWFNAKHRASALYFHLHLPYFEERKSVGLYRALIAPVIDNRERVVSVHRTYLNKNGSGKADIPTPKRLMPAIRPGALRGAAVRLGGVPADGVLGITEGIETAIAVRVASGMTCWSAISAGGLSSFNPPNEISTLHIWADRDMNGVGQEAAIKLADRLATRKIRTYIHIPSGGADDESRDWLDEYLEREVCHAG